MTQTSSATFEPAAYRRSIAEMFCMLEPAAQRDLSEKLAALPRHIHRMAASGLIAHPLPDAPRNVESARG